MGEVSSEPLVYTASSIAPFTFTTVSSVRRPLRLKSQQGRQAHHPSLALRALYFGCEVDGIVWITTPKIIWILKITRDGCDSCLVTAGNLDFWHLGEATLSIKIKHFTLANAKLFYL